MRQPVVDLLPTDRSLLDQLDAFTQWRQRLFNVSDSWIRAVDQAGDSAENVDIDRLRFSPLHHPMRNALEDPLGGRLAPAPEVAHLRRLDDCPPVSLCVVAMDEHVDG